ncbi:MAG TPA: M23 family metallopeptidase [Spirochaetota bacterium]|nr:M23 family metallopeptidase [Spirochaetota bacterium]
MNRKKICIAGCAVSAGLLLITALLYAAPSLQWPVDLQRSISGTLGEQRGYYLHTGIDIKTKGRIGFPILATAAGRLMRVGSKEKGYGNDVLLHHGGYLSHYAHMDGFDDSKYPVDTLMKIVKVLYHDKNISRFDFKHHVLRYRQGERIGYSGETGSGPPHLHFSLRVPGGVSNPLKYLKVEDSEGPILRHIFLCVEKEGTTVSERAVGIKQSGDRYFLMDGLSYRMDNIFYVSKQDKVFLKLGCFDRISSANHCAVHKIEVFENEQPVYSMDFDSLKWKDLRYGRFIYDLSNLAVDGENLYTYYLCRKNGNRYSSLNTAHDGYFSNTSGPRVLKVVASDYAGNTSEVRLAIVPRSDNPHPAPAAGADFAPVSSSRGSLLSDSSRSFTVRIYGGALLQDTLMKIAAHESVPRLDDLIASGSLQKNDVSDVYTVYPFDSLYRRNVKVTMKRPDFISRDEAEHVLIYRFFNGTSPVGLTTKYDKSRDVFEAETNRNGHFVLIRDRKAPVVNLPPIHEIIEDRNVKRIFRFRLYDDLSGVSLRSVRFFFDGERLPFDFNFDLGWAEVSLPRYVVDRGLHHVLITFADRSGNESVFRSLVKF